MNHRYSILERLQKQVYELEAPNIDELHVQLTGLKQVFIKNISLADNNEHHFYSYFRLQMF